MYGLSAQGRGLASAANLNVSSSRVHLNPFSSLTSSTCRASCRHSSSRGSVVITASMSTQQEGMRTVVVKNGSETPFPYTEKDPYKLPLSIERVRALLVNAGWEKPWVEQITDRLMKGMLKTTEERAQGVINYLLSIGLRQDEICNMASISVVLLGLNPETRLASVVNYLKERGVPAGSIPDVVLKHPRIFEYKVTEDGKALAKFKARIQVDVVPAGLNGEVAAAVTYFREGASFLEAPVSPIGPLSK